MKWLLSLAALIQLSLWIPLARRMKLGPTTNAAASNTMVLITSKRSSSLPLNSKERIASTSRLPRARVYLRSPIIRFSLTRIDITQTRSLRPRTCVPSATRKHPPEPATHQPSPLYIDWALAFLERDAHTYNTHTSGGSGKANFPARGILSGPGTLEKRESAKAFWRFVSPPPTPLDVIYVLSYSSARPLASTALRIYARAYLRADNDAACNFVARKRAPLVMPSYILAPRRLYVYARGIVARTTRPGFFNRTATARLCLFSIPVVPRSRLASVTSVYVHF